jgi:NADH-quinone oxidoreductase subunit G
MPSIIIDGKTYSVPEGTNLLQAILSLGLNLQYFCWHPALGSVGACRQCAVIQYRDEKDTRGKIVMACMTPASEGTRISITAPDAQAFREMIIAWLMANHPHDCPVCDEGGECHLQDMTLMSGHNYREYRFTKRTFRNQDLGPCINHEMNRCIECYRCVRYYRDLAGGSDLNVFAAHDHVYFGRADDGTLENEFSGNLVEVCPTGVFTDKTLAHHYTRKWDLQTAPSICQHCGVGCNIIAGERYQKLRRILNRYNHEVNGYFLCDRGRFGYEFVNSARRLRAPVARASKQAAAAEVSRGKAVGKAASAISSGRVIGIGSPRASLEGNYALRKMVGDANFFSGLPATDNQLIRRIREILQRGPARSASLLDVAEADAVLVLGEDLTNTSPMSAFAVRQSVHNAPREAAAKMGIPAWNDAAVREFIQERHGPLYIASVCSTRLDDVATGRFQGAPEDIARLGFAVANVIDASAPSVKGLDEPTRLFAGEIAGALRGAMHPLVIAGMSLHSGDVVNAAANVAWALCRAGKNARISYTVPECNTMGAAFITGNDLEEAFDRVGSGNADTVIIMENDLHRRMEVGAVDEFLSRCKNVIVLDYLAHETLINADTAFPVSSFAEGSGTLINNEGRMQRYYRVMDPDPIIQESWRCIRDIMLARGTDGVGLWKGLDDIFNEMNKAVQGFGDRAAGVAPPASFRLHGKEVARQPHRYSGRTAMHADQTMHEPPPPPDPDSPLRFSMEGYHFGEDPALIPSFWSPGWNSVQALNKFQQEVGGPLRGGDPGVRLFDPQDQAVAPFFVSIPQAFQPRAGEWLALPVYHIFGSEELSSLAPALSQRAPLPCVVMNASDADGFGFRAEDEAWVDTGARQFHLAVKIDRDIPAGTVGLPIGLPGLEGLVAPSWCRISKEATR